MQKTIVAQLAGRPPKPVVSEDVVMGWRCHAHDPHKRVFFATPEQGAVLIPLMEAGGGQDVVLRYGASSTLAVLAGAVEPRLNAAIARGARSVRAKHETLEERARTIFDATPSGHPSGRLPDWDLQPPSIRRIFAGFAARLPYDGFQANAPRDGLPQTTMRTVADALWARDRSPRALATSLVLWMGACELDLDDEGFRHMHADAAAETGRLPLDADHRSVLGDEELTVLNGTMRSLRDITGMNGTSQASVPFAIAADAVLMAYSLSHGRRRLPMPDPEGNDDALAVLGVAERLRAS